MYKILRCFFCICPLPALAEFNLSRLTFSSFEKSKNYSTTTGMELRFMADENTIIPLLRSTSISDFTLQKPQHLSSEVRLQPGFRYKHDIYGLHSVFVGYSQYREIYLQRKLPIKKTGTVYSYDGWINGLKNTSLALNANYLPHLNSYDFSASPGIRLNWLEYFSPIIGVELKYTSAIDYKAKRIGVFVSDFGFPNFRVKLNSGVTFAENKPNDAYIGFSFWFHSSKNNEPPLAY
jgi:hypothetical protein